MDSQLTPEIIQIVTDFISDLLKKFKKNNLLIKMSKCIENKKYNTIHHVLHNISNYQDQIMNKDETMFENDVIVLPTLNLSILYKIMNENERNIMWQHLRIILFYKMISNNNPNNELNNETIQNLIGKLQDDFKQMAESKQEMDTDQLNSQVKGMFIKDDMNESTQNVLNDMIQGVTGCMNKILTENNDPQKLMASLLNFDPKVNPLMSVAKEIQSSMESKVKSGEIKQDDIMAVKNMFDSQVKNMPINPAMLFSAMGGKGNDMLKMFDNFTNQPKIQSNLNNNPEIQSNSNNQSSSGNQSNSGNQDSMDDLMLDLVTKNNSKNPKRKN